MKKKGVVVKLAGVETYESGVEAADCIPNHAQPFGRGCPLIHAPEVSCLGECCDGGHRLGPLQSIVHRLGRQAAGKLHEPFVV